MYPNPVPTEISEVSILAKAGIFNGKYSIAITDVSGKELQKTNIQPGSTIAYLDTRTLYNGTYFIKFVTASETFTKKIMLAR